MESARGVYVSLDHLIGIRGRSRRFSLLPRQPVNSLLSGRHASRLRGRGLNFEELRNYLPGDDVRTIDWRVTARTGKPHVRVYTEERDRPVIFAVDQRLGMFFGTRHNLKSVAAVELAAVGAWATLDAGDRVGAVVFDDDDAVEIRPRRSRRTVMHLLETLVRKNQALRADAAKPSDPAMLNRVIKSVERLATHDCLVVLISDFEGSDEETREHVSRISRRNDVVAVPVFDQAESKLPDGGKIVVSNGELQFELELDHGKTRRGIAELLDRRLARIVTWQRELSIPVLPVSAAEESIDQLRRLLGRAAASRRRR